MIVSKNCYSKKIDDRKILLESIVKHVIERELYYGQAFAEFDAMLLSYLTDGNTLSSYMKDGCFAPQIRFKCASTKEANLCETIFGRSVIFSYIRKRYRDIFDGHTINFKIRRLGFTIILTLSIFPTVGEDVKL